MICLHCGHQGTYRKISKDGTKYIILCRNCAWAIAYEPKKQAVSCH